MAAQTQTMCPQALGPDWETPAVFPIRFVSFSPGQASLLQVRQPEKANHDKAKPEAPAQNGRRGGGRRGQEAARPLLATLGWLVWALAGDESNKRRRQVSREASVPSCASKALTIEAPTRGAPPPPPRKWQLEDGKARLRKGSYWAPPPRYFTVQVRSTVLRTKHTLPGILHLQTPTPASQ